jgi:tetratricopeptide (TPR) repeat protein
MAISPDEADPPLVVDADRVLPAAIAFQRFETQRKSRSLELRRVGATLDPTYALPRSRRRAGGLSMSRHTSTITLAVLAAVLAAPAHSDDAKDCVQAKDRETSIRACTELLRQQPMNVVAYNHRGNGYRAAGNYDLAIADHTKAIEIDPKFALAYNSRCADFASKGDYDAAIADCSKAIELNPKYAAAYFNRGIASGRKGDFDRAIADHGQSISLNPRYAKAYNGRAWAYLKAGDKVQAMADVQRALELAADDAAALDTRAHIFEAMKKRNEAISDFRQALAKDPSLQSSLDGLKRLGAKP